MKLSKKEITHLYKLEKSSNPLLDRALSRAVKKLYPSVLCRCTYDDNGERKFMHGGTPALERTIDIFKEFVIAVETGLVTMYHLDRLFSACHNNGTFADVFIECDGERDAIEFLDTIFEGV